MRISISVTGLLLVVAALYHPAGGASIPWSSVQFEVAGDSIVGRTSLFGIPGGFSSIESRDMRSTSSAVLPIPGPTDSDNFETSVSLGFPGSGNSRGASTQGRTFGDSAGTMTLYNLAGAGAINNSITGQAIKSEGVGTTRFQGQFVSLGGKVDVNFDGIYHLLSFHQNGAAVSTQRAESALSAVLSVMDLTASQTLLSETVFSDSLIRTFFGVSRKDDVPFSGMRSIDLTGTAGNTIQVEWRTTSRATAYAARETFETQSATGAQAQGAFDELNFSFSTIPEPATILLLILGAAIFATGRWPAASR